MLWSKVRNEIILIEPSFRTYDFPLAAYIFVTFRSLEAILNWFSCYSRVRRHCPINNGAGFIWYKFYSSKFWNSDVALILNWFNSWHGVTKISVPDCLYCFRPFLQQKLILAKRWAPPP